MKRREEQMKRRQRQGLCFNFQELTPQPNELRALGRELGVPLQVTGAHSIFGLHFTDQPVRNIRQSLHPEWRRDFATVMMANGVLWPAARIAGFLCTAHTDQHIVQLLKGCRQALELVGKNSNQ